ncbi:MAG: hypothetical protein F6J93_08610 [Oscillatoria sp. SIO1A7]|nr:hypothetical protein [Oscillatoria sp. SIO1A7]
MSNLRFKQSNFPPLYWAECDGSEQKTGEIAPLVGYLLPQEIQKPPASLTLGDSWRNQAGCYIFLDSPVPAEEMQERAFATAVWNYLSDASRKGARFVWFRNPNTAEYGLSGTFIPVEKFGEQSKEKSKKQSGKESYCTRRLALFDFRNLTVAIGTGCQVNLSEQNDSFTIVPPPAPPPASRQKNRSIHLIAGRGRTNLYVVRGGVTLPLCGPLSGCLQFQMLLERTNEISDLEHLDIGLRFFYRDPFFATSGEAASAEAASAEATWGERAEDFFVASQRYPVFGEEQGNLSLYANLDPISPLVAERSYFSFANPAATTTKDIQAVESYYVTNLGHKIKLAPQANARLVFAPKPTSKSAAEPPFYLVPQGDFALQVVDGVKTAGKTDSLMCGLSGVEYVKLRQGVTNILSFIPGYSAFAPGFVPDRPPRQAAELLGDLATTSWVYVKYRAARGAGNEGLIYCAQPDSSVLYGLPAGNASKVKNNKQSSSQLDYLDYMEVPSANLPAADRNPSKLAFPMLPYRGIKSRNLLPYKELELQAIGPARRKAIYGLDPSSANMSALGAAPAAAPAAAPDKTEKRTEERTGATPQGLLASYSSNYQILNQLVLAKNADGTEFLFEGIQRGSPLWTALQTNQLFLVVSDPQAIASYMKAQNSAIVIQKWRFDLEPDKWRESASENPTLLIFKFYNKTLEELAGQVNMWSLPEVFNKAPQKASAKLQKTIQDAIEDAKKSDSGLKDFAELARNKNWNGILALNCNVPLDALPPQLEGLAAGIKPNKFYAHHVGINVSPIKKMGTNLSMRPSSLFGLIVYRDPDPLANSGVAYDFKVLLLEMRFQNSQIVKFASKINLQVNSLYEERATLRGVENNNLFFNGFYQNHNGKPSYVFTSEDDNIFDMTSSVLNKVEFVKAQFVTDSSTSRSKTVKTQFQFWGNIDFKALEGFDIFSFGSAKGEPGQLSIANLAIAMSFEPSDDGDREPIKTFSFNAGNLSFDMSQSKARPSSLFSHFPLKLKAIVQGKDGTVPKDSGYMSATSPLNQGKPTYPWYALVFDLGLGSLGALAEKANFVASLIVAWSPSSDRDYNVFTGLKLPGSSGGKREIDVEGLFKIKMKNIEFYAVKIDGESYDRINYMLRLQSISFGFMGLSLPPSGRTDFLLFGDPKTDKNDTLGWYAVYDKGVKPKAPARLPFPSAGEQAETPLLPGGGK